MKKIIFVDFLSLLLCLVAVSHFGQINISAQQITTSKVNLGIITDEADAVLSILAKREAGQEITESDWQKVFESEGYIRLQKRERSLQRSFEDVDFKTFVLSENLVKRRRGLAEILATWKKADINKIAERPLAYLPRKAQISAKIYPVIKPRENSFVFDISTNPAIFIFLDPEESKENFENTVAHELHHIGFGTACPSVSVADKIKKLPPNKQRVLKWLGAFGEGFAMLAAAGGASVHPHEFSSSADKERWDRDIANFNNDLQTVERFFLDLESGTFSEDEENKIARSFYGATQGPWYTVGWQMAVVIEKTFGRSKLIEVMCDQRKLLLVYNRAVKKYNRRNNWQLALWSKELVNKFK
jgi:hypothetical protein